MENEVKLEEKVDNKKEILIGIFNLMGIMAFTVIGLVIKHLYF